MCARLYIFNPETDYALASDSAFYTPPSAIIKIRGAMALLPSHFAEIGNGDMIVVPEDIKDLSRLPYHDVMKGKGVKPVCWKDLQHLDQPAKLLPTPWGWNRQIKRQLSDALGNNCNLPSDESLQSLRMLSHRRTTIAMHSELKEYFPGIRIPREISSPEEAIDEYRRDRQLYFKAPWSSSGRGILMTGDLGEEHVMPWLRGIISRQGSVMMEPAYERELDFATEWMCESGNARFLGYSVFKVSRRGKYHSNIEGSREELRNMVIAASNGSWNAGKLEMLRRAINKIIACRYEGPLGVDMLIDRNRNVNPCVEVNLRHTMGMIGILKYK